MSEQNMEVVRRARERLQAQELVDRDAVEPAPQAEVRSAGRSPGAPNPKDDKVLMYRGRVIRGGGGGAPGAPSGGRPVGRGRGAARPSAGAASDAKAKLQQLSDLFSDGLLTKEEFDRKRSEIVNSL